VNAAITAARLVEADTQGFDLRRDRPQLEGARHHLPQRFGSRTEIEPR